MNKEQAQELSKQISSELPPNYRISAFNPKYKDGIEVPDSYSFGVFPVNSPVCIVPVYSLEDWTNFINLAFAYVTFQTQDDTEDGDDMSHYDSNSFDDGEGHKIMIAADGSHHDEHEFVG